MLGSGFGSMWGWFQIFRFAARADNIFFGVHASVKRVTDVGGPHLLPHAVLQTQ